MSDPDRQLGHALPALGVGDDYARVDRENFGAPKSFRHAARDQGLEEMGLQIALAETAVAAL
jgi:hypothetical protein